MQINNCQKLFIEDDDNYKEGIELLTGKEAGVKDSEGNYPEGSVNARVYEKLKKLSSFIKYKNGQGLFLVH